jgi:hypothetical protein
MRSVAKLAPALLLAGVLGCSLLVDTSDLDAGCPEGTKLCPGHGCVELTDPAFGCKVDSCIPCTEVKNAVAVCTDFECSGKCLEGFGCAGCRANLLTEEGNCGGCCASPSEECEYRCAPGQVCKAGKCVAPLQ